MEVKCRSLMVDRCRVLGRQGGRVKEGHRRRGQSLVDSPWHGGGRWIGSARRGDACEEAAALGRLRVEDGRRPLRWAGLAAWAAQADCLAGPIGPKAKEEFF
jgi:hypothetical protein